VIRKAQWNVQPAKESTRDGSSSFLKKNQKTFAPGSTPDGCSRLPRMWPRREKFFVSFFQKRNTSLLPLLESAGLFRMNLSTS
jgi:hypothetical protein